MARIVTYKSKKRGREESSEPWRQLARTAPGNLLRVATLEWGGVRKCLKSTHRRLHGYNVADMLRTKDAGNRIRAPSGRTVDASHRKLNRLVALHDVAGHVLALCAARLGLRWHQGGDADSDAAAQRWQAWEERRTVAADALQGLRSALTDLTAALRILHVVSGKPPGYPVRAAWAWQADKLVRHDRGRGCAARSAADAP